MPDLSFPSVTFKITPVSGAVDLDLTMWITSLSWSESNDQLNTLTVQLTVPETDLLTDKDHPVEDFYEQAFIPGGSFELKFFDHPATSASTSPVGPTRTGDIVSVKHGLSASGRRSVTLTGMEALHRLKGINLTLLSTEDDPQELTDILKKVAEEIKSKGKANGAVYTSTTPIILDQGMLGLVKTVAENNHKVIVFDAEKSELTLQDVGENKAGDVTVTWGFDLQTINLALDLSTQATEVEVTGLTDESTGDPIIFNVKKAKVERQSGGILGTDLRKDSFGEYKISMLPWGQDIPVGFTDSADEAETKADATFQNMSDGFLKGSLTCAGKPAALQNGKVTVEEAPWPFAGTFVIDSVSHNYSPDSGLTTEISFFSNMVAKPE